MLLYCAVAEMKEVEYSAVDKIQTVCYLCSVLKHDSDISLLFFRYPDF